jgi:hypothetical protein
MWLDHLPASVAFCDVETTGLGNHDRIVSFGGIGMISRELVKGRPDLAYLSWCSNLWLHGGPLQGRLRGSLPCTPSNFRHAEVGRYHVDR